MTDRTTRSYAEATHKVATEANEIAQQNQTELRSLVESIRGELNAVKHELHKERHRVALALIDLDRERSQSARLCNERAQLVADQKNLMRDYHILQEQVKEARWLLEVYHLAGSDWYNRRDKWLEETK